jgi:predicted metal-dependent phosphoesterase TrpH
MGKADLHVHTAYGDGMAEVPELLDYVESETDLDVIAVTDHDDIRGALNAREVWARGRYRFQLVTGIEVTTMEGHILALFVDEPLPCFRPVREVLEAVHRRQGLCVIPHPLCWLTLSLNRRAIQRIIAATADGVYFDAIEVANQTPTARRAVQKAAELNRREFHLAEVGGSDAHFLSVIGTAHTEFDGETADDLRQAIRDRRTRGVNGFHPPLHRLGLGQIARQTWRGITVTPRTVGWRPTAYSFIRRIFSYPK